MPAELADRDADAYQAWLDTNVVRQRQGDRFALWASLELGDLTPEQFLAIASMMRETGVSDARLTMRSSGLSSSPRAVFGWRPTRASPG